MSNKDILPSSRLTHDPLKGSVMADWQCPGGKVIRLEMLLIYCGNCGKRYGYVPSTQYFELYLCNKCYEKYGAILGTYELPDDEFGRLVAEELRRLLGYLPTNAELNLLKERGELGRALELLERESPYRNSMPNG